MFFSVIFPVSNYTITCLYVSYFQSAHVQSHVYTCRISNQLLYNHTFISDVFPISSCTPTRLLVLYFQLAHVQPHVFKCCISN